MEITEELIESVYKHKLKKLSHEEIATLTGLNLEQVEYITRKHLRFLKDLNTYEEHKTDILMGLQKMVVGLMLQKADKATFRDLTTAFGVLEDKLNLRLGNSTANIAVGMTIRLEDLVGRKEKVHKELLTSGIHHSTLPKAVANKMLEGKQTASLPIEAIESHTLTAPKEQGLVETSVFPESLSR